MKLKNTILTLVFTTLVLPAAQTIQFDGVINSDNGTYNGQTVTVSFTYDETVAPDANGLLPNSAVSVSIDFLGQTFTENNDAGYLGESEPFYALFFAGAGLPRGEFFLAVAENQTALNELLGYDENTFDRNNPSTFPIPLDNASTITDPAISGFSVAAVVPEPSTAIFALVGLTLLGRRRR